MREPGVRPVGTPSERSRASHAPRARCWIRPLVLVVAVVGFAAPVTALAACVKTKLNLSAAGFHQLIQDEGGFRYYRTVTLPDGTRAKRWVPYNDPVNCTVGHGHLIAYHRCTPAEKAKWLLTNQQADALLAHDVASRVAKVNQLVTRGLTQAQFDALVNFVYNAGAGRAPYRDKHGRLRKPGLIGSGILAAINAGDDKLAGERILAYISKQERLTQKGLISRRDREATPFLSSEDVPCPPTTQPPPTKQPPPSQPPPGTSCENDNPADPPPTGCYRVKVQVIQDYYPGDTQHGLGVGVGTATLEPAGVTLKCLNPTDSGGCEGSEDVPVNTTVTITPTPGSVSPDPTAPPDSAFEKFAGSCTGTGSCQLTPSSNSTVVDVYFIPAVATLTLEADPSEGPEMSASGEGHVAGTDPISPVYCGASDDAMSLPCTLLVRVDGEVQVEADDAGDESLGTPSFSDNCPARSGAPNYCDITLTSDQTVTATFGEAGLA